ncbi:hypothetical protein WMY93_011578 [Mugilogobius chulae]|uniref:Matrix remodeling-associated protein 8 n=1 Tax=Mugilogobius chulae TaxID=88201 RepID=A0AAW0PBW9_9GOBI
MLLHVTFLSTLSQGSSSRLGVVVEARNITLPAGARAVLPCRSSRMIWTRDRLKDRQRVVHWDVGRVSISDTAFNDGNFSLVINNVVTTDKGVYTCNLHHHYCQVHQNIQIQLNVTKSARKEKRFWDGEKTVFVVLLGSSVVLPCVNRRPLWREGAQEDQQQVAHWDYQAPGVRPDRAERLVDLYASGERRDYGPLFSQNHMSIEEDAFTVGDFSLSISELKAADIGLYSCLLHHHYCGIQERRIFRLTVGPQLQPNPSTTRPTIQSNELPEPNIAGQLNQVALCAKAVFLCSSSAAGGERRNVDGKQKCRRADEELRTNAEKEAIRLLLRAL